MGFFKVTESHQKSGGFWERAWREKRSGGTEGYARNPELGWQREFRQYGVGVVGGDHSQQGKSGSFGSCGFAVSSDAEEGRYSLLTDSREEYQELASIGVLTCRLIVVLCSVYCRFLSR